MSTYEACLLSRPSRYTSRLLILLLAPLGVCGCTTTLHRVHYEEKDTVFEQGLLGAWQTEDITLIFEQSDGGGYELTAASPDSDQEMEASVGLVDLVAFDGHLFLFPRYSQKDESADTYPIDFYRVDLTEEELWLYPFNTFLFDYLDKHPHVLAHERRNGSSSTEQAPRGRWVVITASAEELQQFIVEHADDPEIFLGPIVFRRAPESVRRTDQ
ncbi:MAG: hypothetical protein IH830_07100 [Planctomycetes bacterium]|nr:hypothetical protein [Planctomycetota bacterium]